ncbi:MAG: hypothetical protein H0V80_17850, partial [Acidobacteria bacterium]|nr:hypothetical protein [Acidobacteriota bacterium]
MSWAALVLLAARPLQAAPAPPATPVTASAIAAAITAVRTAIGGGAEVTVTNPVLSVVAGNDHIDLAVAEPGSRTAGPIRFVLYTGTGAARRRAGRLAVDVRVSAPLLRATTALRAGSAIT